VKPSNALPSPLPLVGRSVELADLRHLLDRTEGRSAPATLLRGEGGVGKTRLLSALADDAQRREWTVAHGQAYPVGTAAPYALFADAFVPLIRGFDPGTLSVLTRGGESDLTRLFPSLGPRDGAGAGEGSPEELKMRLFWNFAELVRGLSGRAPLLIVLEDLQWADEPSLELLHFVARETRDDAVLLVGSYNERFRDGNPPLLQTEQSLVKMGLLEVLHLEPLTGDDVLELTCEIFAVDRLLVSDFAARLFEWTGGNPFFLQETLNGLVQTGQLQRGEGTWVGFETGRMEVPGSIREAVLGRVAGLDADAAHVANLAAVIGNRAPHEVLAGAGDLAEHELLAGIDVLRAEQLLRERPDGDTVHYDFVHPLVRETIYGELGRARARLLHTRVAEALEQYHGSNGEDVSDEHADELAYHFARAGGGAAAHKEVRYLARAGRAAFARHAYGPAAEHLGEAVVRLEALSETGRAELAADFDSIREDRAWADLAVGRVGEALKSLEDLYASVEEPARRARIVRRLIRAHYWNGRPAEGLRWADRGLAGAPEISPDAPYLNLLRGLCLEQMGRPSEAGEAFRAVLEAGEALQSEGLQARAHQALALLSLWTGDPEGVHRHAERACELAVKCGADRVEFWSLWVRATFVGLKGELARAKKLMDQAQAVAARLGSPHLRLWAAELLIEHSAATGDWDRGLAIGEQAIALAENLGYRPVLPRLLVWTGLIHLARGDKARAQALIDAAWELAVAHADAEGADVHCFVPAHIGRAAFLLAAGEYDAAIEVAKRGLEAADASGYFIWGVHRLLPTLAEAYILKGDLDGAKAVGARLRADSERIDHGLGLAWSDACDALVQWKSGDSAGAVERLDRAAEGLEAVPFVWDAARIRRQRAGRLAEVGDVDGAVAELKRAHEVFSRIGAAYELGKTRDMFRELGIRPPSRTPSSGAGTGALTGREVEVARMVSERKSNKAIAKALDISSRTVSTHLSNIFKKVGVTSRGELADLVRTTLLPD
jgi:DNA-binding CsgD family transcriptional regulator